MKLVLITMLALAPIVAFGQEKEVRWKYEYKQLGRCASGSPPFEITFYEDTTFAYKTLGWGAGEGTYDVADSIITCTYSGKAPYPEPEEGWVEARYPTEGEKAPEVAVLDSQSGEPLFGAEIFLLAADGTALSTLVTDPDGKCAIPEMLFAGICAKYIGYKSEEVRVYQGLAGDLIFHLATGYENLIIAKGVKHQFRIWKIEGREIILEPLELGRDVYLVK
ncbi:MAG: carboxypeptidase regulatory-like domain-containing protein [Lewinellaceae bacterium]|nr:carboxypeptidase regulatory-like domain-containing protein [Lewinellaceae bacterium]